MTVLITLTTAGTDSGPFDLYSNLDGFTIPFETGVSKVALQAGYISVIVPDYTIVIRVKSNGDCINYVDIELLTTTSTTTAPTTSTSTTPVPGVTQVYFSNSTAAICPSGVSVFPIALYLSYPIVINTTIVYYDLAQTNPFPGDGTYYWVSPYQAYQINAAGLITAAFDCGI